MYKSLVVPQRCGINAACDDQKVCLFAPKHKGLNVHRLVVYIASHESWIDVMVGLSPTVAFVHGFATIINTKPLAGRLPAH